MHCGSAKNKPAPDRWLLVPHIHRGSRSVFAVRAVILRVVHFNSLRFALAT